MALIKCVECEADISDKASACPKCGCPVKQQKVVPETVGEFCKGTDEISFKQPHRLTNGNAPMSKNLKDYETRKKSPGVAVLLAFIFGPFGTFYSSTGAGFVMLIVYVFSLFGSAVGIFIASVVNMFICYFFTNESNEKLKTEMLMKQMDDLKNSHKDQGEQKYDISSGW